MHVIHHGCTFSFLKLNTKIDTFKFKKQMFLKISHVIALSLDAKLAEFNYKFILQRNVNVYEFKCILLS